MPRRFEWVHPETSLSPSKGIKDTLADFISSEAGQNLIEIGHAADIEHCAQKDACDIVGIYREGRVEAYG